MRTQRIPLLILLLISAATVAVQPVPLPGPVLDRPVIAADPGGGLVGWATDNDGAALSGQRFGADGRQTGGGLRGADERPAGGDGEARDASPRLELVEGRFVVEVEWKDFALRTGRGVAVPHRANTGHFWFFRPEDLDLTVKVVDGRSMNGHFWIYYGALSNVAFTLRITDRVTGRVKTYFGPVGRFASAGDILAFPAP